MYKQIDANKFKSTLLIAVFLVAVIAFGWFLSWYYNSPVILLIAVAIAVVQSLSSYYYSDKIALAVSHAIPVQKNDNKDLYRLVENLSITAGIPAPDIYEIDDPAINAFATGRDPKHASIAVTTGALERLTKPELEGVLAHELSHIGNYDIRLSTVVVVLAGVITLAADFFLRSMWFGGRRRDDREGGEAGSILMIVGIVLAILAPIAATLIQLAISRKRESLADASGALLTRYPDGLADALEKIKNDNAQMATASKATAHMYLADPFKHVGETATTWFSTHPPIDERIAALRKMDNATGVNSQEIEKV